MWSDVRAILWRDVRSFLTQFENPRRFVFGVAASALILVFIAVTTGLGDWLENGNPWIFIWIWCWLPLGSAVTLATDAIAGERERNTLETLLASRMPSRAIAAGKILSITVQAWTSSIVLGAGALVMINIPALLNGEIVLIPWQVLVLGPPLSLGFTFFAVIVALTLSATAPTVRQANFRILIATTMLPIIAFILLLMLAAGALIVYFGLSSLTGYQLNFESIEVNGWTIAIIFLAAFGLLAATAGGMLLIALSRFSRHRLMNVSIARHESEPPPDNQAVGELEASSTSRRLPRLPVNEDRIHRVESPWKRVLLDARIVAWKEMTEAKGLLRDIRGWIVLVGLVLGLFVLQLTALGSWYWSRDADFSILFWLAMIGGLPLIIAQRSADTIAGERERHTGEFLFTTRLSHTGIVVGKLAVNALVPWSLMLSLPIIGLVVTNVVYSSGRPYLFPAKVVVAGAGMSLWFAVLLAAGGMLVSLSAPTVQDAARRMSWFLMPLLLAPGLALRRTVLRDDNGGALDAEGSVLFDFIGSGTVATALLLGLPLVILTSGVLVLAILNRFQRDRFYFD